MKLTSWAVLTIVAAVFVSAVPTAAVAGTTVIKVEAESGGWVSRIDQVMRNGNGAVFWNGTAWCVNDSYAHMFFTDFRTGERLKFWNRIEMNTYPGQAISGTPYTVLKNTYSYTAGSRNQSSTTYTYEAVEFKLIYTDPVTQTTQTLVLRSRGTGNGTPSLSLPWPQSTLWAAMLPIVSNTRTGSTGAFFSARWF